MEYFTNYLNINIDGGFISLMNSNITNEILKQIQPKLELMPRLSKLQLYRNLITSISVLNLPNLVELGVGNNQLTDITEFNKFKKLKILYLFNNLFRNIQELDLPQLEKLYINDNPLDKDTLLPKWIYKGPKHSISIYISRDQIENIQYYIERDVKIYIYDDVICEYTDVTDEIQERNKDNIFPTGIKSARF